MSWFNRKPKTSANGETHDEEHDREKENVRQRQEEVARRLDALAAEARIVRIRQTGEHA